MARQVVEYLLSADLIEPLVPAEDLVRETEALIMDDLMVEDRLNDEVREVLKKFETDIERGRLDYKRLFDLTKQKLIKERNLVL